MDDKIKLKLVKTLVDDLLEYSELGDSGIAGTLGAILTIIEFGENTE